MSNMVEATSPIIGNDTKPKHAGGRPPKLTAMQKTEVYQAFLDYIHKEDDPTVPEFVSVNDIAIQYDVTRENLKDWQEFSPLIKRCIIKQESYLLKFAGAGKYNPTIAIFRLKQPQHGYRDHINTDLTTNGKDIAPQLTPEQMRQLLALEINNADTTSSK